MKNVLLPLLAFGCMQMASADTSIWTGGSGAWGSDANWSGEVPAAGDEVIVNKVVTITLDSNPVIGIWRNGWQETVSALNAHTGLKAGAGNTLTVGSATVDGLVTIGTAAATGGGAVGSNLFLQEGVTFNLLGGAFYIATDLAENASRSKGRSATVFLEKGSSLNLGASDRRSEWIIARMNSTGPGGAYSASNSGGLKANSSNGGGHLTAYLSNFTVGTSTGAPYYLASHIAEGSVDLTGVESALINADRVVIGAGDNASAFGTLIMGAGEPGTRIFQVNESLKVGTGGPSVPNGPIEKVNRVEGTVEWGAGSTVVLGSASSAVSLEVGVSSVSRGDSITVSGTVKGRGGNFSAHLSTLIIGSQNATALQKSYHTTGVLDLRDTIVEQFSVTGDVVIGRGLGSGSDGALYLSETTARFMQNLLVGDSNSQSQGLVSLNNTVVKVEGDVSLYESGRVIVEVAGASSGLFLTESSSFLLSASESYSITFTEVGEAPGIYYGLAWEGEKIDALSSLIEAGRLIWSGQTVDAALFYDSATDTTYIGASVIPEPGSYALLLAALAGGFLVGIKKKRSFA